MKLWRIAALAALMAIARPATAQTIDVPSLADLISVGKLPPIGQRLPEEPLKLDFTAMGKTPGRYGGQLNLLMGRAKDVRMMVVYGYARLVAYNEKFALVPDILRDFDVSEDGTTFTFYLRRGHKWSDGTPFTADDFRYYWEDVVNNEDLFPVGPPEFLKVQGELATFEVIDPYTVRYRWSRPNPFFLPALAGPRPPFIYRPHHFLKRYHARYQDADKLAKMVADKGQRNWAALHNNMDRPYKLSNPFRPTLQPWRSTTKPPSDRFVFLRNPYFHRIDPEGRQLPYIDEVVINIANSKLIPAKVGAGESDLQARGLRLKDYAFLKQSQSRAEYDVGLWQTGRGAYMALFPNLNAQDPVWRKLLRDARFRRALSMAINRREINQVIYFGAALEGNNTLLPGSGLYKPEYREKYANFDLDEANRLLDEIGLGRRDDNGIRLLPDGRALEIIVETPGEDAEQEDVLELITDSWKQAGIKLFIKPLQREVLKNRVYSGQTVMSIFFGIENGLAGVDTPPREFAPLDQDQWQWPKWGQYYETAGQAGEAPDLPAAQELIALYDQWLTARPADRRAIWERMLALHAEQIFSIGLIANVPQPVVVAKRLRNVPDKGFYNWEPGAFFGLYRPDTFWIDG